MSDLLNMKKETHIHAQFKMEKYEEIRVIRQDANILSVQIIR